MLDYGHIRIPRSLLSDPLWLDLKPTTQIIFFQIVSHVCFLPQKFDDHGVMIEILPGQVCTTIREILNWCGKHFTKNDIERSVKKLILCGFLRQEVRHVKSIITVCHKDTYELIKSNNETGFETNLRQDRDKIETQKKKAKKEKHVNKEAIANGVAASFYESLFSLPCSFDEKIELTKNFPQDLIDRAVWFAKKRNSLTKKFVIWCCTKEENINLIKNHWWFQHEILNENPGQFDDLSFSGDFLSEKKTSKEISLKMNHQAFVEAFLSTFACEEVCENI